MAILGYARVSTTHQTNDRQHDALTEFGVDKVFTDKVSGAKWDRAGLKSLLEYAREGDVVVVASLDRFGRSLSQVVATVNELNERGIVLKSIRESIDYSTSVGRMLAGVFAALAEYERELIHERASDARAAVAARGKQTGRPPRLDVDQARQLRSLHAAGESVADCAAASRSSGPRRTGCSTLARWPPRADKGRQPQEGQGRNPARWAGGFTSLLGYSWVRYPHAGQDQHTDGCAWQRDLPPVGLWRYEAAVASAPRVTAYGRTEGFTNMGKICGGLTVGVVTACVLSVGALVFSMGAGQAQELSNACKSHDLSVGAQPLGAAQSCSQAVFGG